MRTPLLGMVAIGALALGACGGGGASGLQGEVADQVIEAADDEDFDLDADCVRDVAGKLSDDDAQKILDAGPDGDAENLSADAEALANDMFDCVDTDALVDSMVGDLVDELGEDNVDVDCIKDAVDGLDVSDPDSEALAGAMFDCISFGG